MCDNVDDDDVCLSEVLWNLHFTTNRIVNGVVDGRYTLPSDIVTGLNDTRDSVPLNKGVRRRGRQPSVVKSSPSNSHSQLSNSATFHRLLLQARVIRDKMNNAS